MSLADYEHRILVRIGEIALKKANRHRFEEQLMQNLRYRLTGVGDYQVYKEDSRIWIVAKDGQKLEPDAVLSHIHDVFGYVSSSPVVVLPLDESALRQAVRELAEKLYADGRRHSFKGEAKRINKQFPINTYALNVLLGDLISQGREELAPVDVHQPDYTIYLEVRGEILLYTEMVPGRKGLPVGMGGHGLLLLSGGIDSPVAGYLMASRGMTLDAVYFHTFPYTSEEAKQKVIDLARILNRFAGRIRLHIVDFTRTQLAINEVVPEDLITIIMRRMMLRIAEAIAREGKSAALITGESLGQVASQTLDAIVCTDDVVQMPVFRPLIGIEKDRTIAIARDIGSFSTSILPYEDCCTVFVAKHPQTHPTLAACEAAEKTLDIAAFTARDVASRTILRIDHKGIVDISEQRK